MGRRHEKAIAPAETAGIRRYYYAAEPCLRIDGTKYAWGWNSDADTHTSMEKAVAIGAGARRGASLQENNWQLTADPLPQMTMEQQPMGTVVRNSGAEVTGTATPAAEYKIPPHSHATLLLDRGHLTTAFPEFTARGGAGASVRLKYAEALLDAKDEKGNRNEIEGKHIVGVYDEFLLDGQTDRVYQPLVWRTWRYLQIDITTAGEPLQLTHFKAGSAPFLSKRKQDSPSDEPDLAKIWQIGWRTARLDAHDTYMDTPYWEQMQYIGDTRIQALISYSVAGDDRLARQAITAFNNSRIPDGITLSRYPTSMFQAIPTFSLLWIGMIHDFWMYRDDPAFVRDQLAGTRTLSTGSSAISAPTDSSIRSFGGLSSIGAPISDSASRPKIQTADRPPWLCSSWKLYGTPPISKPLSASSGEPKLIAPQQGAPSTP